MAEIGSLVVSLVAETADFVAGMKRAEGAVQHTAGIFGSAGTTARKLTGGLDDVAHGADSVIGGFVGIASAAESVAIAEKPLEKLQAAAGLASSAVTGLQSAVGLVGTAMSALTGGPLVAGAAGLAAIGASAAVADIGVENLGVAIDTFIEESLKRWAAARQALGLSDGLPDRPRVPALSDFGTHGRTPLSLLGGPDRVPSQFANEIALGEMLRAIDTTGNAAAREYDIRRAAADFESLRHNLLGLEEEAQRIDQERASAARRHQDELEAAGKAMQQSLLTPAERYRQELETIAELVQSGKLSEEFAGRARERARGRLDGASGAQDRFAPVVVEMQRNNDMTREQLVELRAARRAAERKFRLARI